MTYAWHDMGNGNFLVTRKKKRLVTLEKVWEIEQLDLALLVKKNSGKWTMYASALVEDSNKDRHLTDFVVFLDEIFEYKVSGNLFLYRKADGWYAFSYKDAFWNIDNVGVLNRRLNGIVKICNAPENVISCRTYGRNTQHVIATDKGEYVFYSYYDDINPWGAKSEVCIKHNMVKKIHLCGTSFVKMYDSLQTKFYLGSLCFHEVKTCEEFEDVKYLGNDYYLVIKDKKQKVMYLSGILVKDITDWSDEVTLLEKHIDKNYYVFSIKQNGKFEQVTACRDQIVSK